MAGPEHQELITDYFEKIVLYDVGISSASVRRVDAGYEVTVDIDAQQFEADGEGNETEVPLDTWFQVAVFPHSDQPLLEQQPLYLQQHRLHGGMQRVTVFVAELPAAVSVDPYRLMIDRVARTTSRHSDQARRAATGHLGILSWRRPSTTGVVSWSRTAKRQPLAVRTYWSW